MGEQEERDLAGRCDPLFHLSNRPNPKDWDPYLRRAESEHALNQREAAVADYTRAIELHRDEPFSFLRRGRVFRTMKACPQAAADFEKTANLKPTWAELYNQAAGVYVDCPDPARRNPEKALALIEHAIALDVEHPTYLTVLALAYLERASLKKRQLRRDKHWNRPNSLRGIVRRRQRNYTSMREHSPLRTIEKLGIRLARRLFVMSGTLSESAEPVSDWLTGQTVRP